MLCADDDGCAGLLAKSGIPNLDARSWMPGCGCAPDTAHTPRMVSQKAVIITLTKAVKKAYREVLQAWQTDAVATAAEQFEKRVMLIDHPRGSGKTRKIAMQAFVSLKCNAVRLVLLITDRNELEEALTAEVKKMLTANGFNDGVVQSCAKARTVESNIEWLEEEAEEQAILSITLQTFPHIRWQLSLEF